MTVPLPWPEAVYNVLGSATARLAGSLPVGVGRATGDPAVQAMAVFAAAIRALDDDELAAYLGRYVGALRDSAVSNPILERLPG
jgi:hypothetical protein